MFQNIVVAVDSSAGDAAALRTATRLARTAGGVVHVLHIAVTDIERQAVVRLEDTDAARRVLDAAVESVAEAGVRSEGHLATGTVGEVPGIISRTVGELAADLLVITPHKRNMFTAWFTPRVSDAVTHASGIPVLLVPDGVDA
ncbi:universal stress protein [Streptomyces sp. NPDC012751]|uniref:universal stress protein n=1 Tax=Streptomyces sp. NPDC012751 TaxID=3364846 RepID=UPI00367A0034